MGFFFFRLNFFHRRVPWSLLFKMIIIHNAIPMPAEISVGGNSLPKFSTFSLTLFSPIQRHCNCINNVPSQGGKTKIQHQTLQKYIYINISNVFPGEILCNRPERRDLVSQEGHCWSHHEQNVFNP